MSRHKKLIEKIKAGRSISYDEAESLLLKLGFTLESRGSHMIFRKKNYARNVSLKKRPELLKYQIDLIKEVLDEQEKN